MTIPFYEELMKIETSQRIFDSNFFVDKLYPAYFLPNGELVQIITDHMRAHFLDSMSYCQKHISSNYFYEDKETRIVSKEISLTRSERLKTNDDEIFPQAHKGGFMPEKYKEYVKVNRILVSQEKAIQDIDRDIVYMLEKKIKGLMRRLKEIKKSNCINQFDLDHYYHLGLRTTIYKNEDHFEDYTGTYTEEVRETIKNLIKCEIYIYDYYLNICLKSKNPKEALLKYYRLGNRSFVDVLVMFIGFDKIERVVKNTITTSRLNINEVFFNYLIMEYNIKQIPKYVFDKEMNIFENMSINIDEFSYVNMSSKEKEYAKEIELIKKKVPLAERKTYFL